MNNPVQNRPKAPLTEHDREQAKLLLLTLRPKKHETSNLSRLGKLNREECDLVNTLTSSVRRGGVDSSHTQEIRYALNRLLTSQEATSSTSSSPEARLALHQSE